MDEKGLRYSEMGQILKRGVQHRMLRGKKALAIACRGQGSWLEVTTREFLQTYYHGLNT